jgi:iron complex transport system substrate-binding protein
LPVTVQDKDNKAATIADVSRIIPLNGDVAEIIFALGLGKNVIATDTSATFPPEAAALPKIGYQRTLSAEGILALKPTVLIGAEGAGPPEVLEQLRGAGVPVVIITSPTTLAGPAAKIRSVAAALGIPEAGETVATKTQQEIDEALALAAKATSKPVVMFLYVRGTATQQIGGRGSSADTLITAAGGIDAGTAAGINGFKSVTAEAIVTGKPEVFLLLSAGLQSIGGVDGLLQIPGVAQTPAGAAKRVLNYEDQYLLGLGPRTGQALRELVLGLHPELR